MRPSISIVKLANLKKYVYLKKSDLPQMQKIKYK